MILRELSKIAFSNMGNYYDEYGCLKRMNELTVDEKGAIGYYDIVEIQDGEGYRVGTQSRIKLHNKMSALDKIARHLGFYGSLSSKPKAESEKQESESSKLKAECEKQENESGKLKAESAKQEEVATVAAVVDRNTNNLPMDYPVEDFELEGIELKTLMALEGVDVSPGSLFSPESEVESLESEGRGSPESRVGSLESRAASGLEIGENVENILTISPLVKKSQNSKVKSPNDWLGGDGAREFALRMGADTCPSMGSGQGVAKACAV